MARQFALAGGPNYVVCDVGSVSAVGNGAYTIMALFLVATGNNNAGVISFRNNSAIQAELFVDGLHVFGAGDFEGSSGTVASNSYVWAAIRFPGGTNQHYTYSTRAYNSGSTTHQTGTGNHSNSGSAATTIRLGHADDPGNGNIAVWAAWTSALSDGQVESAFTTAARDVSALSPAALWLGNQASGSDPINDVIGAADQTSVVGTVGTATDPSGYDYALTNTVFGTASGVLGALSGAATGVRTVLGTAVGSLGALSGSAFAGSVGANTRLVGTSSSPRIVSTTGGGRL